MTDPKLLIVKYGGQTMGRGSCIIAACMDPFFLYIPFLSHTKKCLGMNTNMWLVAVVVRSVYDSGFSFGLYDVALDLFLNSKKSDKSIFLLFVHCFAVAPIPQVLFSKKFILKTLRGYTFWNLSLFCQYGIRLVLIFLACEQLKTRVSIRTLVWVNAPIYLYLYLIVSHVIGASWYYLSIKRQLSCWQHACKIDTGCIHGIFRCDGTTTLTLNSTLVNEFCPIDPPNAAVFDYGIFLDALQSHIVEDRGLLKKFLRSFFWGLRHLSSFASNLQTSTNAGETCFAIIISVLALLLLIYIIGNIQRYVEMASARSERIVDKMEEIEPKIKLLAKRHNLGDFEETWIRECIQNALENEKSSFNFGRLHINPLPTDVELLEVEGLENIDEEWFRSMSNKLKPVVYPKESYIFGEGEPLEFIIFITNGIAWRYATVTVATALLPGLLLFKMQ